MPDTGPPAAHPAGRRRPERTFEVPGSDGRPVRATAIGDPGAPAVLVLHGFKGFREWGLFPWLSERLAEAGLRAVRVDFSHNGVEATDFDRLDLFLLDTPERHQEDLRALADHVPGPLGLLGHSRGGADALLFAAREPRVRAVATLASVSSFRSEPPDLETVLRAEGSYPFPNARTGQVMRVGRHAFEAARRLDLETAVRSLACPLLLVHGDRDESVPPGALDRLASWQPRARRLVVAGAGHTFGAVHPFRGPTPWLEEVAGAACAFFHDHLGVP
jgi:pimeloyl-ACP methyl ester carboxylesterase